jgi:hypothetical protein
MTGLVIRLGVAALTGIAAAAPAPRRAQFTAIPYHAWDNREDGDNWNPVVASGAYPIRKNQWCAVSFAPVTTTALRLDVKLQPNWAAGVHEWKITEADE